MMMMMMMMVMVKHNYIPRQTFLLLEYCQPVCSDIWHT